MNCYFYRYKTGKHIVVARLDNDNENYKIYFKGESLPIICGKESFISSYEQIDETPVYFTSNKDLWNKIELKEKSMEMDKMVEHETGAKRSSDADNVRYDLITPVGLRRLAETYAEGAEKYGVDNWKKGFKISGLINHAMRHIELYKDNDKSEDHLAHAVWNLMTAMHFEERMKSMQDVQNDNTNAI